MVRFFIYTHLVDSRENAKHVVQNDDACIRFIRDRKWTAWRTGSGNPPQSQRQGKPLRLYREQQTLRADGEAGTLAISPASHHLLLCAKLSAAHFEAPAFQVVTEATSAALSAP